VKQPVVYILASKPYGTLYIGVTGLKKWNREWKIRLIEQMNPAWKDMSSEAF
jgi:predicted GIY-YIG superfamily endonuclease